MPFPILAAIPVIGEVVSTILKRVLPAEKMSEAERAKLEQELQLELMKQDWSVLNAQLQTNLAEAQHPSLFVAGWRPSVGWVCSAAFGYHFVLQPFLAFAIAVFAWELPPLPALDLSVLVTLLGALLGLGSLRTFEKTKGVAK